MSEHIMKSILPLLLGFLLLSISVAQAKQPTIVAATPVVVLMPIVLNNPDFFEFTDKQKKQIAIVAQNTNQTREDLDQSILDLRNELREEIVKYQTNKKLITYLTKEIQKQENRRLLLSVECADGLRKVMTAEQWKTLIELMQE
ncbi:MAG: hypothetical protein JHC38_08415 [Thiotrichales bacterium]|jgi:uncharacterized membrane protein|nr:hypothetical protein [Thiotrichales bacterium]